MQRNKATANAPAQRRTASERANGLLLLLALVLLAAARTPRPTPPPNPTTIPYATK